MRTFGRKTWSACTVLRDYKIDKKLKKRPFSEFFVLLLQVGKVYVIYI